MKESISSNDKLSFVGYLNKYRKAIMGFAALWIFFFHEWQYIVPNNRIALFLQKNIISIGFCGVDIFLLISGIGLTYSISKGNVLSFYKKRIKRVFIPAFIVYTIIALADREAFLVYLKKFSGFYFFFEDIYKCLWFIPAILTLYLFFPLYHFLMKKSGRPILFTAIAFGIWLFFTLGIKITPALTIRYDFRGFTNRIPVFMIGVLMGELEREGKWPKSKWPFILSLPVLFAGLYGIYVTNILHLELLVPAQNCFMPTLCLALSVPFILAFILEFLNNHAKHFYGIISRILCFYGAISLEFYCVQEWTGTKIVQINWPSKLICNIVILILSTAFAYGIAKLQKSAETGITHIISKSRKS